MLKKHLIEVEKHFEKYSEGTYTSPYCFGNETCKKYYHKKEDCFQIAIFESGQLYQLNSDHEKQGIELKTLDDLKIRFKSFTGEEFEIKKKKLQNPFDFI